jgi:hypothetical protein
VSRAVFDLADKLSAYPVFAHCAVPGVVPYRAIHEAQKMVQAGQSFWICGQHEPRVVDIINKTWQYPAIFQGLASHSNDQSTWLAQQLAASKVDAVALYVPRFHLVRNYLTVLESLRRRQLKVVVVPVPVCDGPEENWQGPTPERIAHEEQSIVSYSLPKPDGSFGDVASATYFFMQYLPWLQSQI